MRGEERKQVLSELVGLISWVEVSLVDEEPAARSEGADDDLVSATALLGSAGETVARHLGLGRVRSVETISSGRSLRLVPIGDRYLGCLLEAPGGEEITAASAERMAEGRMGIPGRVRPPAGIERLLWSKVELVNMLVDEFSGGGPKQPWLDFVARVLTAADTDATIGGSILVDDTGVTVAGTLPAAIREDDIAVVFKRIIDLLCQHAIRELGASQARAHVHAVIGRLGLGGT
ncbi:hypothetical protein AMJ39_00450 [candidate division TA06 bacterium DG_24]|uniref:Roadblock/LAMTOR2 domain-containing protein n=2 Tax=Bacteria division TA06 TaxID=1156500 RepID=A0A0S8JHH0_UNCT6|nr:MAG: hypothetical protein AMJ39_00450 [candidate division TA06 bacterium DG_24]KPL09183.1 MAG: hypothetical protein AMJ71_07105 [candidate division TA06 bacterium SM1_40]